MSNLNTENVFKIYMNGELKDLDPFPSWHETTVTCLLLKDTHTDIHTHAPEVRVNIGHQTIRVEAGTSRWSSS